MTGGKASMSDEIGAAISAWDGYITGRNLHLVRGKRIVQSWRTSRFTDAHADSIVTITLRAAASGTVLMLEHSNVPDDQRNYEDGGWEENYFAPMKDYFTDRARQSGEKQPRLAPAKKKTRAKRAPSATTPKKAREAPEKATACEANDTACRSTKNQASQPNAAGQEGKTGHPRGAQNGTAATRAPLTAPSCCRPYVGPQFALQIGCNDTGAKIPMRKTCRSAVALALFGALAIVTIPAPRAVAQTWPAR